MKRFPLGALFVFVVAAVLAAGAVWHLADLRAPSGQGTPAPVAAADIGDLAGEDTEFGGPFSLIDQNGKRRADTDFRGKYMLIFFGYTYCPDVCPTALAVEAQALDMLGARASLVVPIFISVDFRRDTPEKLKAYLSAFDPNPPSARQSFVGLTGSEGEIAAVAKDYRVFYEAHLDGFRVDDVGYSIDHTADTYLMSPEGKFVSYYSMGITPDEMAADLARRIPAPG